eukprot:XP_011418853.1 PREDICTED: tetraspanin-1 [Crassostrea gigas]
MALDCDLILMIVFLTINIIFCFMGLGLIIVGSLTFRNVSDINTDHIKSLLECIQAVSEVTTLSIIIIIIGVVIFVFAALGFFGAYSKRKYILVEYANLVFMLLVMKIIVISLWLTMKSEVETEIQSKMLESLKNNFVEDTVSSTNSFSNEWNYMFMKLDCCGVNPVVSTTNDFDATSWCTTSGSCQATSSQIPKTCCLNVDENTYTSAPSGCHASVNSGTYNAQGCYDALKEALLSYSSSILGLLFTTIFIEIFAVICAFLIRSKDRQLWRTHCPILCKCLPLDAPATK